MKGKGVQIKETKTGEDRTVSVREKLLEILKKLELSSRQDQVRGLREWSGHFFIFGKEFRKPILQAVSANGGEDLPKNMPLNIFAFMILGILQEHYH